MDFFSELKKMFKNFQEGQPWMVFSALVSSQQHT